MEAWMKFLIDNLEKLEKCKNVVETLARIIRGEFVSLEERVYAASDFLDLLLKPQQDNMKRNSCVDNK